MKKIFFLLLIITNTIGAQTIDELFEKANTLYKNGDYKKAIAAYQEIEKTQQISDALYYNLGNSYYKLNKVAPTIYNYEKALQINPLHQDTANNLVFAKRLTLDRIEKLPQTFLQRINKNYLQKLSYNTWSILTIIFSFLSVLLFLGFYFAEIPFKKRLFFTTSILSFLLLFTTLAITYSQYNYHQKNKVAIIFAEKTEIKNAPTLNSDTVFTLHEGTKIILLDAVDTWKKIKLADGKIGWILSDDLKEL